MKTEDRKKIHKIFVAAKKFLSTKDELDSYKEEFICLAIGKAGHVGGYSKDDRALAVNIIMSRLGEHYTAEDWLEDKIGADAIKNAPKDSLQKWRHRWLDSLIVEFSK